MARHRDGCFGSLIRSGACLNHTMVWENLAGIADSISAFASGIDWRPGSAGYALAGPASAWLGSRQALIVAAGLALASVAVVVCLADVRQFGEVGGAFRRQ